MDFGLVQNIGKFNGARVYISNPAYDPVEAVWANPELITSGYFSGIGVTEEHVSFRATGLVSKKGSFGWQKYVPFISHKISVRHFL